MDYYNVVFEHTTEAGGYAGVRFIVGYSSERAYKQKNPPGSDKRHNVIAEGVSKEQARDLVSLTPEICHLTAAIENMCYAKDGHVDKEHAFPDLFFACCEINYIRQDRFFFANHNRLSDNFTLVQVGPEDTDKNKLFRFVIDELMDGKGRIGDTQVAIDLILSRIDKISQTPSS